MPINMAWVNFWRVFVLALLLSVWQWGDAINQWLISGLEPASRKALTITILEPFFISKPTHIWSRFLDLACFTGPDGTWLLGETGGFAHCMDATRNNLWAATGATLRNTFLGFLVGVSSGVAVGLILGRSEFLARVFEPFIVAFNSLPRIALVPLIILVFGLGDASKIVTAWVIVFFVVFFSTYEGACAVDRDHISVARLLGASGWQITWTVVVPSTLAWVFAVLSPALSFSLIGVIIGEFIGAQVGLGKIVIEAEATLETADMMVALFVLMVVGVALALAIRRLQAYLLRWQSQFSDRN